MRGWGVGGGTREAAGCAVGGPLVRLEAPRFPLAQPVSRSPSASKSVLWDPQTLEVSQGYPILPTSHLSTLTWVQSGQGCRTCRPPKPPSLEARRGSKKKRRSRRTRSFLHSSFFHATAAAAAQPRASERITFQTVGRQRRR